MPTNAMGTMGGAFIPQAQTRATGDKAQEAEVIIVGDGTIGGAAYPISQQTYTLTKGSAAAIKLLAPTLVQSGTVITLTAGSAFAHVVTATGLIEDGVTGGAKTTATLGAFKGASLRLVASQKKWNVVSLNVCVIT